MRRTKNRLTAALVAAALTASPALAAPGPAAEQLRGPLARASEWLAARLGELPGVEGLVRVLAREESEHGHGIDPDGASGEGSAPQDQAPAASGDGDHGHEIDPDG